MQKLTRREIFAVRHKEMQIVMKSSSGGVFTALSDHVLENDGAVVCSVYDYIKKEMQYRLVTDKATRDKARGSKYIQSNPCDIYSQALRWVIDNPDKKILFIGTGCQSAAFRELLSKKGLDNRAYVVDIICQGVSSPRLWRLYAERLEKKHGGEITYLTFKDKRWGWRSPLSLVKIRNREILIHDYVRILNRKISFRPACFKCPYTTLDRYADITIGDYWGVDKKIPGFYNRKGNSLVVLHTASGKKLFDQIRNHIDCVESTEKDCEQPMLLQPVERPEDYEQFWSEFEQGHIEEVVGKYGRIKHRDKIKILIKYIIGSLRRGIM